MAELQQLRVQEAVDSMVKSLERENIRKMQVAGGGHGGEFQRFAVPFPQPRRAAARLPADSSRGVPGVAAASSEAPLSLRTPGASAERLKSVIPHHAQGRSPPPFPPPPQASSRELVLDPGPGLESSLGEAFCLPRLSVLNGPFLR